MSVAMNTDSATNNENSEERWAPPVKSSATPVDRDLSMRGIGRGSVRKMVLHGGYGLPMTQEEIELAFEAFKSADFSFAWRDDERELDGKSVADVEAWATSKLHVLERAVKMVGEIDLDSKEMCVAPLEEGDRWRVVALFDAVIWRLSSLCFETWVASGFSNAALLILHLFGLAIYGPLPDGDSPPVKGVSIGPLRHAAITGGELGTRALTLDAMAEHLMEREVDPFVAKALLEAWARDFEEPAPPNAVRLKLFEIAKRQLSEGGRLQ